MRIATSKKIHYDSGPNLTPLVDVVMVLLIFLMLVGKFTAQDTFIRSNLPLRQQGAGGATPPPGGFPQEEPLEINLDSPTPDRFVARIGQYKAETAAELNVVLLKLAVARAAESSNTQELMARVVRPTELSELIRQLGIESSWNRAKLEDTQIVITPGRDVKYKFLIEVYTAAQLSGFKKVGFSTAR